MLEDFIIGGAILRAQKTILSAQKYYLVFIPVLTLDFGVMLTKLFGEHNTP
jgi:hypothetical protein